MKYPHLFSKGKIGKVEIRNRVVMSPVEVGMANFDGTPSEQLVAYYEERARNGLGLLFTGITRVNDLHGASLPRQLSMSSDRYIKPFAEMVERVHRHGTKIFCQLHHPGRQNLSLMVLSWPALQLVGRLWPGFWKLFPKLVPATTWFYDKVWAPAVAAPSAIPCGRCKQKTRALSKREIRGLVRDFIDAAVRVQKSGADGVELHASHGYLIQQFLSSRTNKRTDEYGGSLENRMRFLLEIIKGVRGKCGPDYPIAVRLSVDEFYRCIGETDCGIELDEGVEMAAALERAGIDAIDVSSASYETMNYWLEPISFEPGWRKDLARSVKEKVSIPVIAANLIRSAAQAEKQLARGDQDFIALGRQFLADPEWIAKVKGGREKEISRCISCLWCFESLNANAPAGLPLECSVNPRLGREKETAALNKNGKGRAAAVIGAGPAGLAAAEVLALRGFKTVVFEKNRCVGGQLQLANKPPKKEKIDWCFRDLETKAKKAGARIVFNSVPGIKELRKIDPYAVIVATGGEALMPPIDGVERKNVCTYAEILGGAVKFKRKKIAVIGSGMTGLETAEKLAEDGNRIVVVEMLREIGPGAYDQNLDDVLSRLRQYGPEFITGHRLVSIGRDGILLKDTATFAPREISVDGVVLAVGVRSNDAFYNEIKGEFAKVKIIGDAKKPGRIHDAVRDGFDAAREI
ncbi:MAG TPA: FAD-dependent oxidoreductase [Spirochaetota bacterium]|nr:FAD-dependent oxidoreductase [Spirochaetota bacterium]